MKHQVFVRSQFERHTKLKKTKTFFTALKPEGKEKKDSPLSQEIGLEKLTLSNMSLIWYEGSLGL